MRWKERGRVCVLNSLAMAKSLSEALIIFKSV
jgi:hypothetical protein